MKHFATDVDSCSHYDIKTIILNPMLQIYSLHHNNLITNVDFPELLGPATIAESDS